MIENIVGNFEVEFLFDGHREIDKIKAVCAEISGNRCILGNKMAVYLELLANDFLDSFKSLHFYFSLYYNFKINLLFSRKAELISVPLIL